MRIVIISHSSQLEGAERSLLEILNALKAAGHKLVVIVREQGDFTAVLRERGIEFHEIKYGWWSADEEMFSKKWLQRADVIAGQIAAVAMEYKAHLIYSNTSVVPFGGLAALKAGLPHVWHIRELASGKVFDKYRQGLEGIGQWMGYLSNALVFNSVATSESWLTYLPKGVQTEVVYNPIVSAERSAAPLEGSFKIGVIGSILPIKQQELAIRVLAHKRLQGLEIELEIIGPIRDESYYSELNQLVTGNGLEGKVHFRGYREDAFSEPLSLCLICGNSEGFGRVAVEAVMRGVPVLAARGGATDELIREGETGFLYESGNLDELADRIAELSQRDHSEHASKARLQLQELLSDANTLNRLIAILEGVSEQGNKLSFIASVLNPYEGHIGHMEFVKSGDLLKEVLRRRLF